jgi:hypothetical protein
MIQGEEATITGKGICCGLECNCVSVLLVSLNHGMLITLNDGILSLTLDYILSSNTSPQTDGRNFLQFDKQKSIWQFVD